MNNGYSAEEIFNGTNPNENIFVVKGEKGSDSIFGDDNRHSMIGDAVKKHETSLSAIDRVLYHEAIHFADGNIVMKEPNMYQTIHNHRDMDEDAAAEYLAAKGVFMDIDLNDMLEAGIMTGISIEDYEKNIEPREVPSTPKDKFRYCGNSRQLFYDSFPEDHPEADKINMLLMMLKNNIDKFFGPYIHVSASGKKTEYSDWNGYFSQLIENWHENGTLSTGVACAFLDITRFIVHEDTNENGIKEAIEQNLTELDNVYGATVRFEADCRALMGYEEGNNRHTPNEAYGVLAKKEVEWEEQYSKNASSTSLRSIYSDICKTGFDMYSTEYNKADSEITQRKKMGFAWFKYRSLKRRFAPRIVLKGVNLNRCFNTDTLCNLIGFTKEQASTIISRLIEKEFKSLNEVFTAAKTEANNLMTPVDNGKTKVITDIIDTEFDKAIKYKNIDRFLKVAPDLIRKQKAGEITKEFKVWKEVWAHYSEKKEEAMVAKAKFAKKAQVRQGGVNV